MLGLIVGTVCVIGLVKAFRRRGYCAGGGPGWGRAGGSGFGASRWWLRSLFERLETTPGQERVIMEAIGELKANRASLHDEMKQTRTDFGQAISGGLIDDAQFEETFARHDRLLARLRVSMVEAMKKISETLDPRQREQLAKLLQGRGWGPVGGWPWREPHGGVWA